MLDYSLSFKSFHWSIWLLSTKSLVNSRKIPSSLILFTRETNKINYIKDSMCEQDADFFIICYCHLILTFFLMKKQILAVLKVRGEIICGSINKYNEGFMDWHLKKGSFTDVTDRLMADLLAVLEYNRFDYSYAQIRFGNTAMSKNFSEMSLLYNGMSPENVIFSSDLFLIQMMKEPN